MDFLLQKTIRKTLSDFKRTHSDNWKEHKEKFTANQLSIISDQIIFQSYYV
jgi:proteasome activator subunit 4